MLERLKSPYTIMKEQQLFSPEGILGYMVDIDIYIYIFWVRYFGKFRLFSSLGLRNNISTKKPVRTEKREWECESGSGTFFRGDSILCIVKYYFPSSPNNAFLSHGESPHTAFTTNLIWTYTRKRKGKKESSQSRFSSFSRGTSDSGSQSCSYNTTEQTFFGGEQP